MTGTAIPYTFLHLTDIHLPDSEEINAQGDGAYAHTYPEANLYRVIEAVGRMQVQPRFIVITGDLTNGRIDTAGSEKPYRALRRIVETHLAPLGIPVFMGMGNHDHRSPFRRIVLDKDGGDEATPIFYAADVDGLRIIMLDSKITGSHEGRLGPDQLAWLRTTLETPSVLGTVLAFHHSIATAGGPFFMKHLTGLEDAADLAEVITGSDVIGLVTGDIHLPVATTFGTTLAATAPAVSSVVESRVRDGYGEADGPGMNICAVADGRMIVNAFVLPSTVNR